MKGLIAKRTPKIILNDLAILNHLNSSFLNEKVLFLHSLSHVSNLSHQQIVRFFYYVIKIFIAQKHVKCVKSSTFVDQKFKGVLKQQNF